MSRSKVSGHFLQGGKGPIFILLREPTGPVRGCVLVLPPFAEEMNKCRRMVAEVSLGLAAQGIASLVPDLYGTGDSGGDFADTSWADWQHDVLQAHGWSVARGRPTTAILAVRLGCAMAAELVSTGAIGPVGRTVLWQPVFDGERFLNQFLRLRVAASLMEQDRKQTLAELRSRLRAGEMLEVAGYGLSSRLASDLDGIAVPDRLPRQFGDVTWMEVLRDVGAPLPGPSARLVDQTRGTGALIVPRIFGGEPFWASTEIVRIREMIDATVDAFSSSTSSQAQSQPGGGHGC